MSEYVPKRFDEKDAKDLPIFKDALPLIDSEDPLGETPGAGYKLKRLLLEKLLPTGSLGSLQMKGADGLAAEAPVTGVKSDFPDIPEYSGAATYTRGDIVVAYESSTGMNLPLYFICSVDSVSGIDPFLTASANNYEYCPAAAAWKPISWATSSAGSGLSNKTLNGVGSALGVSNIVGGSAQAAIGEKNIAGYILDPYNVRRYKGEWVPGTYVLDDLVLYTGAFWHCEGDEATGTPGVDAAWVFVENYSAWSELTDYVVGNTVHMAGTVEIDGTEYSFIGRYLCLQDSGPSTGEPQEPEIVSAYWNLEYAYAVNCLSVDLNYNDEGWMKFISGRKCTANVKTSFGYEPVELSSVILSTRAGTSERQDFLLITDDTEGAKVRALIGNSNMSSFDSLVAYITRVIKNESTIEGSSAAIGSGNAAAGPGSFAAGVNNITSKTCSAIFGLEGSAEFDNELAVSGGRLQDEGNDIQIRSKQSMLVLLSDLIDSGKTGVLLLHSPMKDALGGMMGTGYGDLMSLASDRFYTFDIRITGTAYTDDGSGLKYYAVYDIKAVVINGVMEYSFVTTIFESELPEYEEWTAPVASVVVELPTRRLLITCSSTASLPTTWQGYVRMTSSENDAQLPVAP